VLVRAGADEPEVFMVRRHAQSSFGTAYAFPGGVVDPEDKVVHRYCVGNNARAADANLGVKGEGLDYYSAAVRELFEESGVLLADAESVEEDLRAARDSLNDGSDNWAQFVQRNAVELHCDALHYVSHWITPPSQTQRYSTRFFLAVLPNEQQASHCGGELTESCWATAQAMLDAGRAGELVLHYPTIKTLESIARYETLDDLVEWAASCVEWGVTSMLPMIIKRGGKAEIVLPGDKDYPGYEE
jgi:8-oxo-dGTP pyrophosphatase MutT (NUDIX family)